MGGGGGGGNLGGVGFFLLIYWGLEVKILGAGGGVIYF